MRAMDRDDKRLREESKKERKKERKKEIKKIGFQKERTIEKQIKTKKSKRVKGRIRNKGKVEAPLN